MPAVATPDRKTMERAMERMAEAWQNGLMDAVDEVMAPDVVAHTAWGDIRGVEAYKSWMAESRESLADTRVTLDDVMVDGDRAIGRYTVEGRHAGPFAGVDPTGKTVSFTGCTVARFEGDRCVEEWSFDNTISVLEQVGAVPGGAA